MKDIILFCIIYMPNMSVIKHERSVVFSSDAKNGAQNVRNSGAVFDVNFPYGNLSFPVNAINPTLEVVQSVIPYISPNISNTINNNHFYIEYKAADYDIVMPDGLYDLDSLSAEISRNFSILGIPPTLLTWIGNSSTQRVIIEATEDVAIDFTQNNTFRYILGFEAVNVVILANENTTGTDIARFNTLTAFRISASFSQGIQTNGERAFNILTEIPIFDSPGSIQTYEPQHPLKCEASNLIGTGVSSATISLRSQTNQLLELLGESYSFVVLMRWITII